MAKKLERRFFTTNEVAGIMGVDDQTVSAHARDGSIPRHCYQQKGTGPRRFTVAAVDFFEANGRWPNEIEQAEWHRKTRKDRAA